MPRMGVHRTDSNVAASQTGTGPKLQQWQRTTEVRPCSRWCARARKTLNRTEYWAVLAIMLARGQHSWNQAKHAKLCPRSNKQGVICLFRTFKRSPYPRSASATRLPFCFTRRGNDCRLPNHEPRERTPHGTASAEGWHYTSSLTHRPVNHFCAHSICDCSGPITRR